MKHENVQLLLTLVANYVEKTEMSIFEIQDFLNGLKNCCKVRLTNDEKSRMVSNTIAALNCGSDEAVEDAFKDRLKALCSGDDELIEKIEYLWEVI